MRKQNGFTLVELLVVMSIVTLLIALLLPALSASVENSRMTVCLVNLRSQGQASLAYTQDFKQWLPPVFLQCQLGATVTGGRVNPTKSLFASGYENADWCSTGRLWKAGYIEPKALYCPNDTNKTVSTGTAGWLDAAKVPKWDSVTNPNTQANVSVSYENRQNWIDASGASINPQLNTAPSTKMGWLLNTGMKSNGRVCDDFLYLYCKTQPLANTQPQFFHPMANPVLMRSGRAFLMPNDDRFLMYTNTGYKATTTNGWIAQVDAFANFKLMPGPIYSSSY